MLLNLLVKIVNISFLMHFCWYSLLALIRNFLLQRSKLHYDADNILHCVVAGRKDWILVNPKYASKLDMVVGSSGQVKIGVSPHLWILYLLQRLIFCLKKMKAGLKPTLVSANLRRCILFSRGNMSTLNTIRNIYVVCTTYKEASTEVSMLCLWGFSGMELCALCLWGCKMLVGRVMYTDLYIDKYISDLPLCRKSNVHFLTHIWIIWWHTSLAIFKR